jgi:hypothetical protein
MCSPNKEILARAWCLTGGGACSSSQNIGFVSIRARKIPKARKDLPGHFASPMLLSASILPL